MSVDNWAACPRCHAGRIDALAAARLKLKEAYGVVSGNEYAAMVEAVAKINVPDFDRPTAEQATFREDYEFTLTVDGRVQADYSGSCTVCDYRIHFTHEHTAAAP